MTLRVPTNKAESVGMRKLSSDKTLKESLDVLKTKPKVKRTMWSRRAQEYEAKINSGDLISIAEVVRDLFRADTQPEQSYSERQLYESALDRMAREVAAANGIAVDALRIQATVEDALNHHVGHQPSLLQDLLAGRPTETDSIHGAVVRAAERHGIATPMNRALHQLISLAQQRAA